MAKIPEMIPMSDLCQDASTVLKQVQSSHQPFVITQQGHAAAILLSVEAYERLSHNQELLYLLAQGEKEIAEGVGFSLDEVLAEADKLLAEDIR